MRKLLYVIVPMLTAMIACGQDVIIAIPEQKPSTDVVVDIPAECVELVGRFDVTSTTLKHNDCIDKSGDAPLFIFVPKELALAETLFFNDGFGWLNPMTYNEKCDTYVVDNEYVCQETLSCYAEIRWQPDGRVYQLLRYVNLDLRNGKIEYSAHLSWNDESCYAEWDMTIVAK